MERLEEKIHKIDDNIKLEVSTKHNKHKFYLCLKEIKYNIGTIYLGCDPKVFPRRDKYLIELIRDVYSYSNKAVKYETRKVNSFIVKDLEIDKGKLDELFS